MIVKSIIVLFKLDSTKGNYKCFLILFYFTVIILENIYFYYDINSMYIIYIYVLSATKEDSLFDLLSYSNFFIFHFNSMSADSTFHGLVY